MRKILLVLVALCLMVGVSYADGIPINTAVKTEQTVWTQAVYNGSGDDIQSALVVRWDIDASTNDLSMWVEQLDSAADARTAGVIPYGYPLTNGTEGVIIVKGPAICYNAGNTTTENTFVEGDSSGRVTDETTTSAVDKKIVGWVIKANAGTAANTNLNSHYSVVFVEPTAYENGT